VNVVGRTRFCIHPREKVSEIPAVGGTKNWDMDRIRELKPDLLILDKEENPKFMAEQDEFPYLANVSWRPRRRPLVQIVSRDQRKIRVVEVDVETGATTLLREDTDPHWLELISGLPDRVPDGRLVYTADIDDTRRLLIGEKSPTGSDLFAKRNDEKKVFLIPASQESTLNRSTFELRDKTLLKFERDKVDAIGVEAGGKSLQLAKDNTEWKITQPLQARADYGSVEGLIGRLQTAGMKSIVSDNPTPADLKQYGLDKPAATVDLKLGSARATLAVGGKAADNTVYARDASKPAVVTIESALMDDLKKGADDYRRKDLFEFRAYNANRVELIRGKDVVVFERVKGQGENAQDKWRRVSPNAADADRDKVDAMLAKLANMRATSFVDGKGSLTPALEIHVKFDDSKKEERITFVKDGADVLALRPGEPGAAKTDAADLTETLKSLDELSK